MTHQKDLVWISNFILFRVLLIPPFWIQTSLKSQSPIPPFTSRYQVPSHKLPMSVLNHFTLNCLLDAAPYPDDRPLVEFDSDIHNLPLLCSHNCHFHSGYKRMLYGPADPFVLGCMPSTLLINLLLNDIVFIKDSNPLVEGSQEHNASSVFLFVNTYFSFSLLILEFTISPETKSLRLTQQVALVFSR